MYSYMAYFGVLHFQGTRGAKVDLAMLELDRACELEGGSLFEIRSWTRACISIDSKRSRMTGRTAHGMNMPKQIVDYLEIPNSAI